MLNPLDARGLLKSSGIHPRKRYGQNFIVDRTALAEILRAADLSGGDTVVEIGAGLGALTLALADAGAHVMAVEIDHRLLSILERVVADRSRVEVIEGDALKLDLSDIALRDTYAVVANIPYSITSALIRRCLEAQPQPTFAVLTVQEAVAERVIADPGQMSLLALSVQIYGVPEIRAHIPARAFYPVPEIDSAVVRIDIHGSPALDPELNPYVFRLARAGFSQRRKMLRNSLAGELVEQTEPLLNAAGINPAARAQELSLTDWSNLAEEWARG